MLTFIKKHTLLSLYSFIFCVLLYGVIETSGSTNIISLLLFFSTLLITYFSLYKKIISINFDLERFLPKALIKIEYLTILSLVLIVSHYLYLGYIPVFKAMQLNDIDEIAWVRTNITINNNTFFNYASSILIRAVLPFVLLYSLVRNKRLSFIILSILFSFYAFSLMQKSFVITLMLPSLIYVVFTKKALLASFNIIVIVTIIFSLGYVTNPQLNPIRKKQNITKQDKKGEETNENTASKNTLYLLALGLKNRVIIVPGEMVSKWFETIPSQLPHTGINGYRFIANARNVPHIDYDKELYPIISKQYHDRGLTGTVNAASFMYEYAYFGKKGLVLSGIILALVFLAFENIFKGDFLMKLSLNFYPILILSSTALTISLLSGGWLFIVLFYLIFNPKQS